MSQNTFPQFTNMMPTAGDIQLIVDSLREEDRSRITKDGIFTPGIVNEQSDYLSAGTNANSIKIKPFIAYTLSGNRVEVSSTWDNLYPQGSVINVSAENLADEYKNIPVWYSYSKNYTNLTDNSIEQSIKLTTLGKGSILHGIKVRTNELFSIINTPVQPNITISIGTSEDPVKFLPETSVSESNLATNLSVMNLMYSLDDNNTTDIIITFKSDSAALNTLTSGSITVNVCMANLSQFDNSDLDTVEGGYQISNTSVGSWQPSTTYHIVARYVEDLSKYESLNYTDNNGNTISTTPEPTRVTTNYKFFALRKTGSVTDITTSNDVKLGEVVTDNSGTITSININGKNPITGNLYTQYLTLPGYRFVNNIDASQIADGTVSNTKFQYLNTLTSNVQTQLNSKPSLSTDNVMTGKNTFTEQIVGSIDKVNGFTAYATPTPNNLLVLDENGKIPADAISESTISSIGSFYTVSGGITTNGRSDYLEANDAKNGVIIKATQDNPLIINYPNGSVEKIYNNVEVEGLSADGYYYLIKEKNGNYNFLPTSGGTEATIPVVSSGNSFYYKGQNGSVSSSFQYASAYKAFDGTITDGALMGSVTYKNFAHIETTGFLPSNEPTYIEVTYPVAINPTGLALCFRKEQYDATPKTFIFEGSNDDGVTWTQLYIANNCTWNIGEIKYIETSNIQTFKKFRIIFNVNSATINNYMLGEQTRGITMPIMCYYWQIYATNTDTTNKGNIVEGYKMPSNMNIGSYFLDISKKPFTGYKVIGNNQTTEVNFIKLGFVNLTGYNTDNVILTCYPFCYNTFTFSDEFVISQNDPIVFDHNLGVIPNIINARYVCLEDNNGYTAGDIITEMYTATSYCTFSLLDATELSITSLKLNPGSTTQSIYIRHKETHLPVQVPDGKWAMIIYCSRGW